MWHLSDFMNKIKDILRDKITTEFINVKCSNIQFPQLLWIFLLIISICIDFYYTFTWYNLLIYFGFHSLHFIMNATSHIISFSFCDRVLL